MAIPAAQPVKIFYCYARKDRALQDKLDAHLAPLRRLHPITIWHDGEIVPGSSWEQAIEMHLNTADIILLLVSPAFMQSDYCYSKEMRRALERHHAKEAHVVPILLRPVFWKDTPIEKLQMLPSNARPITSWRNRDQALENVAEGIRKVLNNLRSQHPPTEDIQTTSIPTPPLAPIVWSTTRTSPSFQAKAVKVISQNGAFGCQYSREQDRLYMTDYWNKIALLEGVTSTNPSYHLLGTGYVHPAGIAVPSDGKTLYLTDNGTDPNVDGLSDREGRLLRVDLTSLRGNRKQATLLYSEQRAFHQMTLDETRGDIYFVTSKVGDPRNIQTFTGSLIRFHLETSEITVLANNFRAPFGFLLSSDYQIAYTVEAHAGMSALIRHNLSQGTHEVLWANTGQILFCAWGNVDESAIIIPNRSRGGLWYIDVSKTSSVEAYQIADLSILPSPPNSTTRLTDELFPLLVNCDHTIALLDR